MSLIIENYYKQAPLPKGMLERKKKLFDKHTDIADEFEFWIQNGKYVDPGKCLVIEGYSAEKLATAEPLLDGEGAFVMLVELRESPEKAKRKITAGFSFK